MADTEKHVSPVGSNGDDNSSDHAIGHEQGVNEKGGNFTVGGVEALAEKLGDKPSGLAPVDDVELVMDRVNALTVDECKIHIQQLLEEHNWDYNFPAAQRQKLEGLLEGPREGQSHDDWELELKSETAVCKFYSPYPEVRAVTTPVDDPNIPCETIRAHLLGYIWAIVGQFVNSFFNARFPNVTLTSAVAQVLLYPCGLALSWVLPDWGFTAFGSRHSLNPGAWTYKEQMLATIIIDVSLTSDYVFWNIQTQEVYYGDTWLTPGYKILLLLSTQLMGLGFAGMLRRFVVYPTQTFWPSVLPTLALNRALLVPEKRETINGWKISKYKFFFIVFVASFVYYWLPGFLMPFLSVFAWMTWIAPDNFNLATVTGGQFGLGYNPISSFDWNVFGQYSAPLTLPFFSYVQQYIGTFFGGLVILAIYYSNHKWTSYLPINSSGVFDNTGNSYNTSKVVVNGVLDEAAYKAYSPAFYGAANLVVYFVFFAFYPLTFVFIILDQWRILVRAYRNVIVAAYSQTKRAVTGFTQGVLALVKGRFKEAGQHFYHMLGDSTSVYEGFDDPFTNMMRQYKEVPDWWFLIVALIAFVFAIILLTQFPELNTPVWTIFFVVGLNLIFLIPMTFLYAISGTTEGLNVVTELIVGYALPGHPEALMFVKAYGYNINGQADSYISDQKMGHYAKIPPRAMFRGQVMGTFIAVFICYAVVDFVDTFEGICTPGQVSKFTCANGSRVYYSASIVWGLIGPDKIFSQIYPAHKYAFLMGFILALVWWGAKHLGPSVRNFLRTKAPRAIYAPINMVFFKPLSLLRNVHPSLILNGMLFWAPLSLNYYTGGLYLSFAFMWYIKNYKTAWFEKYLYVLSAGISGGVAFSALIIFFAVQYHPVTLDWWPVNILSVGVDAYAGQTALIPDLPEKGYFGPDTWY